LACRFTIASPSQVEEQFLLGQYNLAVFAALRDVEDRVRKLAEAPKLIAWCEVDAASLLAQRTGTAG
jgi:hypothetical protein